MKDNFLNRNYLLSVASSTLMYMASSMLITVSPKYASELAAGGVTIGALMVAYTLSACFTRLIWGELSNAVGRVAVMYIGVMLGVIATVILLLKGSILLYFISRIIFGMGFSAVVTAGATLSTEVVERKSLSKAIAIYGLGGVLAQGVAPPLALMLYRYGIKAIVLTVCLLLGLCFFSSWSIKCSFKKNDTYKGRIFESRAVPMSAVAGIITFSTAGIFSFVPILTTLGQVDNVSGFFMANSVGLLFSRLLFSKINKKIPTNKLYSIALAVFVLSFLGITIAGSETTITFSGLLYGLGLGTIHPILNTKAVCGSKSQNRAGAMAVFYLCQDLGVAVGSVVCGMVAQSLELKGVFFVCGIVAAFSLIPYIYLTRQQTE